MKTQRQIASSLVKSLLDKQISYKYFATQYPSDTNDNEIEALFDLIEHQPKLGGFLGVRKDVFDEYQNEIFKLIKLLDS